ncbi:MAG: ubiquinone biosynthesis protein UbiB, partial [Methyloligellaceae bacterium]
DIPSLLTRAERTANSLSNMATDGLRLDDQTIERLAIAQSARNRWGRAALWIVALALVALTLSQF